MKFTVTKQYRTETGHRLLRYDGKCAHLHGHSYLWEVTATGGIDVRTSMVVDFKHLKTAMRYVLDPLDHAMVLCFHDKALDAIMSMPATNGNLQRVVAWMENPTAESFAEWAAHNIQKWFDEHRGPDGIVITRVRVWETVNSSATWELEEGEE